uniref:Uncharacterized protein n=1 Tax=Mycena chlorophos TaxID=658473 RepID=A0ABQ0L2J3_MYCCL|nr:predicted protein [Mycena chlorophos]
MAEQPTARERAQALLQVLFADATGLVSASDRAIALQRADPALYRELKKKSRAATAASRRGPRMLDRACNQYQRRFLAQQGELETDVDALARQLRSMEIGYNGPTCIVPPKATHALLSRIWHSNPTAIYSTPLAHHLNPPILHTVYKIAQLQQLVPRQMDLEQLLHDFFALAGLDPSVVLMDFFV